jgi:hypothetical protein
LTWANDTNDARLAAGPPRLATRTPPEQRRRGDSDEEHKVELVRVGLIDSVKGKAKEIAGATGNDWLTAAGN